MVVRLCTARNRTPASRASCRITSESLPPLKAACRRRSSLEVAQQLDGRLHAVRNAIAAFEQIVHYLPPIYRQRRCLLAEHEHLAGAVMAT